jgi:hypothetical protein
VQPRDLQVLDLEAADRRSSDHQPANRQGADGSGADSRCPGRGRADADRCQKHRWRLLAAATELHRTVGASSTVHVIVLLLVRLGVAERANDNAPSADRIVSHGEAGERVAPPGASVSDSRQPTEREVEAAAIGGLATWSGGVSIRIPSSRSNRRTWPAHSLPASLAWRALCLLADAPMLEGGTPPGRGQWAQLLWDPRPLPQKARERRPRAKPLVRLEARLLWHLAPAGCCCGTALSGGALTGPQACEAAPHAWWRRAPNRRSEDTSGSDCAAAQAIIPMGG